MTRSGWGTLLVAAALVGSGMACGSNPLAHDGSAADTGGKPDGVAGGAGAGLDARGDTVFIPDPDASADVPNGTDTNRIDGPIEVGPADLRLLDLASFEEFNGVDRPIDLGREGVADVGNALDTSTTPDTGTTPDAGADGAPPVVAPPSLNTCTEV